MQSSIENFSSSNSSFEVKKINPGFRLGAPQEQQIVAYFSKVEKMERSLQRSSESPEKPHIKDVTFKKGDGVDFGQGFENWNIKNMGNDQKIDTLYKAIKALYQKSGAYDEKEKKLLDYHVTSTICSILANDPNIDVNDVVAGTDRLEVDFANEYESKTIHFTRKGKVVFKFKTDDRVDLSDPQYTAIKNTLDRNREKNREEARIKLEKLKGQQEQPTSLDKKNSLNELKPNGRSKTLLLEDKSAPEKSITPLSPKRSKPLPLE